MALLACLCSYTHLFSGVTNRRGLRSLIAATTRQISDLRRPGCKELIHRITRTQRYELDRRRIPTGCLLHQELHADRQPHLR